MTDSSAIGAKFKDFAGCLDMDADQLEFNSLLAALKIALRMSPPAVLVEEDELRIRLDNIANDISNLCFVFGIDIRDPGNQDKLLKCFSLRAYYLLDPRVEPRAK